MPNAPDQRDRRSESGAQPAPHADDLALVLSGGGARAAYQVGALAGIAERAGNDVRFPIVTGVSAGAINAAHVASSSRAGRRSATTTTASTGTSTWTAPSSAR